MKLTDKLINKVGVDKILHYLVTAWIISQASLYGFGAMIISFIALLILGFIKEYWIDTTSDWADFAASFLGGITSIILYIPYDMLLK